VTATRFEPSAADHELWPEASFVARYSGKDGKRTRHPIAYISIAPGEKLEAWDLKYRERVAKGLKVKIHADRVALRLRKRNLRDASARFACLRVSVAARAER
jgi:hypothetical protein